MVSQPYNLKISSLCLKIHPPEVTLLNWLCSFFIAKNQNAKIIFLISDNSYMEFPQKFVSSSSTAQFKSLISNHDLTFFLSHPIFTHSHELLHETIFRVSISFLDETDFLA